MSDETFHFSEKTGSFIEVESHMPQSNMGDRFVTWSISNHGEDSRCYFPRVYCFFPHVQNIRIRNSCGKVSGNENICKSVIYIKFM